MKIRFLLSSLIYAAPLLTAPAETFYEPFSYEPGLLSGVGSWTGEEEGGAVQVMPGSLKLDGLAASLGNRAKLPATQSKVHPSQRPLETNFSSPWFSFLIRVDSTEGMDKESAFGFFRLARSTGQAGPGLYIKPGTTPDGGFSLVASKRANPDKCTLSPGLLAKGVPHLIVGHYDTTAAPHVLRLWVDPASGSLGSGEAPAATFETSDGRDLDGALDTLVIGGGVKSPGLLIDEIRVGESWNEVTPSR